jgi:hypothetical protein
VPQVIEKEKRNWSLRKRYLAKGILKLERNESAEEVWEKRAVFLVPRAREHLVEIQERSHLWRAEPEFRRRHESETASLARKLLEAYEERNVELHAAGVSEEQQQRQRVTQPGHWPRNLETKHQYREVCAQLQKRRTRTSQTASPKTLKHSHNHHSCWSISFFESKRELLQGKLNEEAAFHDESVLGGPLQDTQPELCWGI